jgi:hypothetical protein
MLSVEAGLPLKQAIVQGASEQAAVYDSHVDNTINAVAQNNMPMAITHAEHVINIVVGRSSTEYSDYNGNDRAENPGDGVGLAVYLTLLQQTALAAASADASQQSTADAINSSIIDLLTTISSAKDKEASITAADSIDEMTALTNDLKALHVASVVEALIQQALDLNLSVDIPVFPGQP